MWAIGVSELSIPWTNYFDDYVAFASLHEQQRVDGRGVLWTCVLFVCALNVHCYGCLHCWMNGKQYHRIYRG